MSLYPTKTRLILLEAVGAGRVLDSPGAMDANPFDTWDTTGAEDGKPNRKVTSRIDEMVRAGWVAMGADGMHWELTTEGRAVLDAQAEAAVWREVAR